MVDVLILPPLTNPGVDTNTEDVNDEILIDSAISEVYVTLEVQTSQRCTGGRGSQKSKVRLKAWVIKQEQGPMAKTKTTVVKKIPALSKNVSSNALKTKTKIASMLEKIQVLNKDINATEDEKINEMMKVSEEIAEYHY